MQRFLGDSAPALNWNDDQWRAEVLCFYRSLDGDFPLNAVIMRLDAAHHQDHRRNQDDCDPSAFGKFRDQNYSHGDRGGDRTEAVDEHALPRARSTSLLPMDDHARLR